MRVAMLLSPVILNRNGGLAVATHPAVCCRWPLRPAPLRNGMTGTMFHRGPRRGRHFNFPAMASLRALQLPPTPEPDFLQLRYRPDLRTLAARWQRPVSPAEFRQGYAAMLAAAETVGCWCWLVDLRSRTAPAPAEWQWLLADFLPQLPGRLGAGVYLGVLLPPNFAVPPGLGPEAGTPTPGLLVRDFSHEGDLMDWLTHCRRPAPPAAGQC